MYINSVKSHAVYCSAWRLAAPFTISANKPIWLNLWTLQLWISDVNRTHFGSNDVLVMWSGLRDGLAIVFSNLAETSCRILKSCGILEEILNFKHVFHLRPNHSINSINSRILMHKERRTSMWEESQRLRLSVVLKSWWQCWRLMLSPW